mgnify:FL=1
MRIIGGRLKGKSLFFLKSLITRPLKDSVRENIFNVLSHSNILEINLKASNILDIYSGFGSFGLECISRGANKITFVEKNEEVIKVLNKNINNLSLQKQTKIVNSGIENFLHKNISEKFEIIFLDPPYAKNDFIDVLISIQKLKIYKKNHIIILHREKKSNDNLNKIINPIIVKQYGRSKIIFGKFLN